jgi:two-component system CheB/CheR fusion protein
MGIHAQPMQTEQDLKESLELFSSTFYQAAVGMVHVDMSTGKFLRANKAICDLLGYTEEEFCTKTITEVTHPEDVQGDLVHAKRMIDGDISTFALEKRLLRKDGSYVWIRLTAASVTHDSKGHAKYGFAVCEDITPIKHSEQALQESEARFKTMADSTPVAIFIMDANARTTYVNKDWLEYTGSSLEESLGEGWQGLIHSDDITPYKEMLYQAVVKHESFQYEVRIRKADNRYGWFLITGIPQYSPEGVFLGHIGTSIDITPRKLVEESLERARFKADEANRKKSEFLSFMSHELRTPLNTILGYSQMLGMGVAGPLNASQKEYVDYVISAGEHLLKIVSDLLDVAKVEADKMSLYLEQIDLAALVDSVSVMMSGQAAKKNILLNFEIETGMRLVEVDPSRFKQILINLIGNAIKFNQLNGIVTVRFKRTEDLQWFIAEIEDNGVGIPPQQVSRLFTKFSQAQATASHNHEGVGLGLVLTKELVELHGGTISVDSEPGRGTIFTVKMPYSTSCESVPSRKVEVMT